MKAVLISIQPKWCELIASGKKTVEVRKTKPKLETPFKCYIYETQSRTETPFVDEEGHHIFKGRGQVIGEFVCDRIVQFENSIYDEAFIETRQRSCVPMGNLLVYIGVKDYGYGWHISDLKIYDDPRELSEFKHECNGICVDTKKKIKCERIMVDGFSCNGLKPITRPPQSWCYVEVQG